MNASPPIVIVTWEDAAGHMREPFDETLPIFRTVGFLVKETKKALYVAHDICDDEHWREQEMDFTTIPRKLVISKIVVHDGNFHTPKPDAPAVAQKSSGEQPTV